LRVRDIVKEWMGIEVKMGWSDVKRLVGRVRAWVGLVGVGVVSWAVYIWVLR